MTGYEQSQAFGGVIDVLEAIGARYAIWGGMAVVAPFHAGHGHSPFPGTVCYGQFHPPAARNPLSRR